MRQTQTCHYYYLFHSSRRDSPFRCLESGFGAALVGFRVQSMTNETCGRMWTLEFLPLAVLGAAIQNMLKVLDKPC